MQYISKTRASRPQLGSSLQLLEALFPAGASDAQREAAACGLDPEMIIEDSTRIPALHGSGDEKNLRFIRLAHACAKRGDLPALKGFMSQDKFHKEDGSYEFQGQLSEKNTSLASACLTEAICSANVAMAEQIVSSCEANSSKESRSWGVEQIGMRYDVAEYFSARLAACGAQQMAQAQEIFDWCHKNIVGKAQAQEFADLALDSSCQNANPLMARAALARGARPTRQTLSRCAANGLHELACEFAQGLRQARYEARKTRRNETQEPVDLAKDAVENLIHSLGDIASCLATKSEEGKRWINMDYHDYLFRFPRSTATFSSILRGELDCGGEAPEHKERLAGICKALARAHPLAGQIDFTDVEAASEPLCASKSYAAECQFLASIGDPTLPQRAAILAAGEHGDFCNHLFSMVDQAQKGRLRMPREPGLELAKKTFFDACDASTSWGAIPEASAIRKKLEDMGWSVDYERRAIGSAALEGRGRGKTLRA